MSNPGNPVEAFNLCSACVARATFSTPLTQLPIRITFPHMLLLNHACKVAGSLPYCNAAITNCPARSSRLIASTMRFGPIRGAIRLGGWGEGDAVCGMEMVVLGAGDDVRLGTDVGALCHSSCRNR